MKIDIRELVEAMFYHRHRKCVDLQEGKLVDDSVLFSGKEENRYVRLPEYSLAYFRQQYLKYMHSVGVIKKRQAAELLRHPAFDLEYKAVRCEEEREYISETHRLFEKLALESTAYDLPDQVREYPTYYDFEETKTLEFAKDWCRKNGVDFYDSYAIPILEEAQRRKEEMARMHWKEWYQRPIARSLYTPEDFERIIEKEIREMHEEWLQKKAEYEEHGL